MGRKQGSKGLIKKGWGSVENQQGVRFTKGERKKLESLVNSANRKRNTMLKQERDLPYMLGGRPQGGTIGETLGSMDYESDFVLAKKSKSLHKFETKKEYKNYIRALKHVVKRDYVLDKVEIYKKNYLTGVTRQLEEFSGPIAKKLKSLSNKQFLKYAQGDEALSISFVYSPLEKRLRAEKINNALDVALEGGKNAKTGSGLRNNNKQKRR